MDGLSCFIDKTWDKIKSQKELNLPDQRSMVANFRCNELKTEAIEQVSTQCAALRAECERGLINNFDSKCMSIIEAANTYYNEFAHQYEKETYHKVGKELL